MTGKLVVLGILTIGPLTGGCGQRPAAPPPALTGAWRSALQFKAGAFASIKNLEFM